MNFKLKALVAGGAATLILVGSGSAAHADDVPATAASWVSGVKLTGHIEAGATFNPASPPDGINFGHLFTDKSNQLVLNSLALTAERDPDTKAKTIDIGFKVQVAYGTDSRVTQEIGEFNRSIDSRTQFDIVEAHLDVHMPYLTVGGVEAHIGEIPSLEGAEVIDPTGNFFYSKSYLFNFGTPLKFTGIMTEIHLSPLMDIYLGVNTGVNTFLGSGGGANDNKLHFHGGVGLNFKTVTVLASTQIGPEDFNFNFPAKPTGVNKNRYLNDAVFTWKIKDKLTSITDINYTYDELIKASAGGVTQYVVYVLNPTVTVGARGEIWRDDKNFYAAAFPGHFDFINFEGGYGRFNPTFVMNNGAAASNATYAEFTFGLNWKPAGLPKAISGLTIRPELRYDMLLTDGLAYDARTRSHQTTIGIDFVAPFTF